MPNEPRKVMPIAQANFFKSSTTWATSIRSYLLGDNPRLVIPLVEMLLPSSQHCLVIMQDNPRHAFSKLATSCRLLLCLLKTIAMVEQRYPTPTLSQGRNKALVILKCVVPYAHEGTCSPILGMHSFNWN